MVNSSLAKYPEVTLCARFLTYHFSTHPDGWPYLSLISYWKNALLSSYLAKPCEHLFQGCTDIERERIAGQHRQWTEGKVFGSSYISGHQYYYPVWLPGVWNTVCITVRASQQHYRLNININGHTVVQTEDIADDFSNSFKARI